MAKILFYLILFIVISSTNLDNTNVIQKRQIANDPFDESTLGWYQTFADDFEDQDVAIRHGAEPSCFSGKASCMFEYSSSELCPEIFKNQLTNLNKCNWNVYSYYNHLDYGTALGEGINSYDPSQVEVKNGYLYLRARRSEVPIDKIDCKNSYIDPRINRENKTNKCPIISGGLESRRSQPNGSVFKGFDQAYGRFEVRAKLPKGAGTWPALWMISEYPVSTDLPFSNGDKKCGWPYNGEIDLVETWSNNYNKVFSGYIHGRCDEKLQISKGFSKQHEDVTNSFHLYAVEWTPNFIRFLHDNEIIGTIYNKEMLDTDKGGREAWIPNQPFYWILNLSIEKGLGRKKVKVDINNFQNQEFVIDYVKTYRRCEKNDSWEKCIKFPISGTVVQKYNDNLKDSAFGDINIYPNPILINQNNNATLRLTLFQSCQDVRAKISGLNGVVLESINNTLSKDIKLIPANEDKYFEFALPSGTKPGLYLMNVEFKNCGTKNSFGNLSYKFLVI